MLKFIGKNTLDKFGPFGSALGASIGSVPLILCEAKIISCPGTVVSACLVMMIFFPYLFSTCTHRKYLVYSSGGLGGIIGAICGFFVGGIIVGIVSTVYYLGELEKGAMRGHVKLPSEVLLAMAITHYIFVILLAFIFSRYTCNRAKMKQIGKRQ